MLGDTKLDMLEDDWNFTIMVSFWIVLSETKLVFIRPRWNFSKANVCFVKWAEKYKARHGVGELV